MPNDDDPTSIGSRPDTNSNDVKQSDVRPNWAEGMMGVNKYQSRTGPERLFQYGGPSRTDIDLMRREAMDRPAAQADAAGMREYLSKFGATQGQEQSLADILKSQALGQGIFGDLSPAQKQMKLGQEANLAATLAASHAARGAQRGTALYNANQAGAQANANTNAQMGVLRAQESMAAQQALGGVLGNMQTGQLAAGGLESDFAKYNAGLSQSNNALRGQLGLGYLGAMTDAERLAMQGRLAEAQSFMDAQSLNAGQQAAGAGLPGQLIGAGASAFGAAASGGATLAASQAASAGGGGGGPPSDVRAKSNIQPVTRDPQGYYQGSQYGGYGPAGPANFSGQRFANPALGGDYSQEYMDALSPYGKPIQEQSNFMPQAPAASDANGNAMPLQMSDASRQAESQRQPPNFSAPSGMQVGNRPVTGQQPPAGPQQGNNVYSDKKTKSLVSGMSDGDLDIVEKNGKFLLQGDEGVSVGPSSGGTLFDSKEAAIHHMMKMGYVPPQQQQQSGVPSMSSPNVRVAAAPSYVPPVSAPLPQAAPAIAKPEIDMAALHQAALDRSDQGNALAQYMPLGPQGQLPAAASQSVFSDEKAKDVVKDEKPKTYGDAYNMKTVDLGLNLPERMGEKLGQMGVNLYRKKDVLTAEKKKTAELHREVNEAGSELAGLKAEGESQEEGARTPRRPPPANMLAWAPPSKSPPPSAVSSDEKGKQSTKKGEKTVADHYLDALERSASTFTYKDPKNEPTDHPTGRPYMGIMAQELEKTPTGDTLVKQDPHGLKYLELGPNMMAMQAALGRIHERVNGLEGRK